MGHSGAGNRTLWDWDTVELGMGHNGAGTDAQQAYPAPLQASSEFTKCVGLVNNITMNSLLKNSQPIFLVLILCVCVCVCVYVCACVHACG